jgi:hypothetical protein
MRAETFALFFGIAYLCAGLLGLIPAALQPPPADAPPVHVGFLYGYLLGLFPVNVLHSGVHLAIGVWGILSRRGITRPKVYARSLAIFYGALAVMGAIPGLNTFYGVLPIHGHDIWLHAGTALIAAYFGWSDAASVERRRPDMPDRRDRTLPIGSDRRAGHSDRRQPGSEV